MLLLDTNILMYASGSPHRFREPCRRLLDRIATGNVPAAIDAETLQEVLHRYRASKRWALGLEIYAATRGILPSVLPVTAETVDLARDLLVAVPAATPRDAIHAAVARLHRLDLCSYDQDFDRFPGLRRVEP
jgi:predicted nucleic acid-binding protein